MDQRCIIYFLRTSGENNIEMFEKFHRWLNGSFICKRCGRELYTMSFGFGEAICPDCYSGERQFLFFDDSYLLNRIITLFLKHEAPKSEPPCHEPIIIEAGIQQEIELVG
jgi:hypothetical protein